MRCCCCWAAAGVLAVVAADKSGLGSLGEETYVINVYVHLLSNLPNCRLLSILIAVYFLFFLETSQKQGSSGHSNIRLSS